MSRRRMLVRPMLMLLLSAPAVASVPMGAGAQIVATPGARSTAGGPRLPVRRAPEPTMLPGERSVSSASRAASGATIHLSTFAIVVGVVILAILLL